MTKNTAEKKLSVKRYPEVKVIKEKKHSTEEGRMVSPDEIFDAAKHFELNGKDPETENDWILVMSFFAVNTHPALVEPTCKLLKKIFDIPLSDEVIERICDFELQVKERRGYKNGT